jgi:hypothetical protein
VSIRLYDFLANKIDWLKKIFANIDEKVHFRMWFDGTNYRVIMLLILAIFRQLIAFKGLRKVFEKKQKKSLNVFEYFCSWRLRTLPWHKKLCENRVCLLRLRWIKWGCVMAIALPWLRPCYTVQFFLQLAMQFYSWEMLISEISEEFSICWENISGV